MDQTIDFIKYLKGNSQVEINNLNNVINYNQAKGQKSIYFCCGLSEKSDKRCKDDDIKTKKYYAVDIDIRLLHYDKTGIVLSQDEVNSKIADVVGLINGSEYADYTAVVSSGNGVHLYYSGDEREFKKEVYFNGVTFIYEEINEIVKETGYICDPVCCNLARIMRLPGTINPRRKERKKEILWDLGDFICEILTFQEVKSKSFEKIEEYAELQSKKRELEKQIKHEVRQIVKDNHKNDNVRSEINNIPIGEIVEDVWGVKVKNSDGECITLDEGKKNMGAYIYKPENVVVNKGSSLIKHKEKKTFTCYELVYFEKMNRSGKDTVEYFKDRYHIEIKEEDKDIKDITFEEDKELDLVSKVPFTYGLDVIDERFGRYDYNTLNVIIGESQSGKTEWTYFQARKNAKLGYKTCYLCVEMTKKKMIRRMARKYAGISKVEWDNKIFDEKKKENFLRKYNELRDYSNIDMVNVVESNIGSIIQIINEKYLEGYKLFYIDNLGFIKEKGLEEQQVVELVIRQLKKITNQLKLSINLLHHFTKGGKMDRIGPRGLESIRGSGKIENDADNVIQVWRDLSPEANIDIKSDVLISLQKDREHGDPSSITIKYYKGGYISQNEYQNIQEKF